MESIQEIVDRILKEQAEAKEAAKMPTTTLVSEEVIDVDEESPSQDQIDSMENETAMVTRPSGDIHTNRLEEQKKPQKTRGLTPKQWKAVHLVATGMSDSEVAKEVGVKRQTVNVWKNHNPEFDLALNSYRIFLMEEYRDKLLSLIPKACQVLEDLLKDGDPRVRLDAVNTLLKNFKFQPITKPEQPQPVWVFDL